MAGTYTSRPNTSKPYNIILTRDPNVVGELFFDKLNRTRSSADAFDLIEKKADGNSFIISPKSSNEFISMDFSFEAKGKSFISIRMVETERLLEFFFVTANGYEEAIVSRMLNRQNILGDNRVIEEQASSRPPFYLAFGMGDVISTWSGPYVTHLADCNLSMDANGVRELELLFTPSPDTMKVFTNRLLSDAATGKDSIFANLKAQGPSTNDKPKIVVSEDFPTTIRSDGSIVLPVNLEFRDDNRQEVGEGLALAANVFASIGPAAVREGLERLRDRTFGILDLTSLGPEKPKEPLFSIEDYYSKRTTRGWNIAVRKLILKYLAKTFPSVPLGNILVIFDDDLDAINPIQKDKETGKVISSPPMVIEGRLDKLAINPRKDIIKRCSRNLEAFGISISYSNKPLSDSTTSNQDRNTVASNVTGQSSNIQGGSVATGPSSLRGSNSQRDAQAKPVNKNAITLSMGVVIDDDSDSRGSPIATLPLASFQKRIKEISNRPSDFVLYEEHNTHINNLLYKNRIIQDWSKPVVIFGRKSLIDTLIYDLNIKTANSTLVDNIFPNHWVDAIPDTEDGSSKNNWNGFRQGMVDYRDNTQNKYKLRTSSFGETFDIKELSGRFNREIEPNSVLFAANVKNANVQSLSFDSKPYLGVLMDMTYETSYRLLDRYYANNVDQLVKNDLLRFRFVDYLKEEIDKRRRSGSRSSTVKLIKDILKSDRKARLTLYNDYKSRNLDGFSFIDLLLFKLNGSNLRIPTVEQEGEDNSGASNQADLIQRINKSIFQVNIRTLPFFNTDFFIGQKCFLFGQANNVVGSKVWEDKPAIFTNDYTIIGYKHHIDKDSAHSEFSLVHEGMGSESDSIRGGPLEDFFKKIIEDTKKELNPEDEKDDRSKFDKFIDYTQDADGLPKDLETYGGKFIDGMESFFINMFG